jgi:hypothetical protein
VRTKIYNPDNCGIQHRRPHLSKRWETQTGLSELSAITEEPRRIRLVSSALPRVRPQAQIRGSRCGGAPDVEDIDTQGVGEHRLVDDTSDDPCVRQEMTIDSRDHIADCVQSEFGIGRHLALQLCALATT